MELLQSGSHYTDKHGITHPIPKKKTRYEMFGFPEPTTDFKDTDRSAAKKLTAPGARKDLVIEYIREASTPQEHVSVNLIKKMVAKKLEDLELNDMAIEAEILEKIKVASRGAPLGVLVAFKKDDHVYVGWSKRNTMLKKVEKGIPGKEGYEIVNEPLEKLNFTKTDALQVAILRALSDKIIIIQKGANNTAMRVRTSDNSFVPHSVEKVLPDFVERVSEHFGAKISNVVKRTVTTLNEYVQQQYQLGHD